MGRKIALAVSLASALLMVAPPAALAASDAPPALANVGLPYTFRVGFISGGSSGVDTPSFYTNSSGRLCVDPNLSVDFNEYYHGGSYSTRYKIRFMQERGFGDTEDAVRYFYASSDGRKVCVSGLNTNDDYHLNIRKTSYNTGVVLKGSGVLSYS